MRPLAPVIAGFALLAACSPPDSSTPPTPATATVERVESLPADPIAQALADPNRPAEDVARDAARKPAEVLAFAGVAPGAKVADFIPGGGYFTRILAKVVGPAGHVYALAPPPTSPDAQPAIDAIAADPAYGNVTVVALVGTLSLPEPVDLVFTAQNYHDLHLTRLQVDVPALNQAIFDALKPGGVFLVIDHAALPGTGLDVPDTLHRIDPEIVKQEVTAAGFLLDGESDVLRNPEDPRTANVFDPAIRGNTDQFIHRYRKPD
jgi:predicted methyltransferase